MSEIVESPPEIGTGPFEGLAMYLRDNPEAVGEDPQELALEFGVPVEFVEDVQSAFFDAKAQPHGLESLGSMLRSGGIFCKEIAGRIWRGISKFLRGLTNRPWHFLVGSMVGGLGMILLLDFLRSNLLAQWTRPITISLTLATLLIVLALQGICYFRQGRARYPMVGSGMVLAILMPVFLLSFTNSDNVNARDNTGAPINIQIALVLTAMLLTVLYLFYGMAMSLFGGFVRVNRESRQDKKLSRQELLGRLLELESQLKKVSVDGLKVSKPLGLVGKARSTTWFPLFALAFGALFGVFEVAVMGTYSTINEGFVPWNQQGLENPTGLTLLMFFFFIQITLQCFVGYLAGNVPKAILALVAMNLGQSAIHLIPYGYYGPEMITRMYTGNGLLSVFGYIFGIGLLTGIGAMVDENFRRKKKLGQSDPAQILAEVVQLQWRLNLGVRATCVLSVDVAGSTKMKAGADQLRIEWSFREYQQMVDDISRRHSGHVFSTAGDGAVIAFPSCETALAAAREMQRGIADFNHRKNRLDVPFRIRVGMHTGETQSQLGDAPFNELIDIAAHIESVAPVGGIAVSGKVAKKLEESVALAELAQSVDGQKVFVDLNPLAEV